jgi:CubicO group peptidase (beta-lactamase class C family)
MRILFCLIAGLACTALLAGRSFAQPASTQDNTAQADSTKTLVPGGWQDLHDKWQRAANELKVPGLAVVVVKGDRVVLLDAIGTCDPQSKQPVTPRSPFYLASVTKSFTALGIAILVEEGKVKLDEPVKTYLPRFTLADDELANKITVRDLLCHRYGLDSEPITMSEAYFGNITDERYYGLLKYVRHGNKFAYSNLHYTLLGRVIEAVSGKPWQDFLAERVFAPLEMRDSTCYASKLYANPLVAWPLVGKDGKWERAPLIKNDRVMHAAGGMGASAADLGNWLRFHLTGKTSAGRQLISPELLAEVHKEQVTMTSGPGPGGFTRDGYSLGWFTGSFQGHALLEHGGGYIGTATLVSVLPKEQVGVAVLVNESRPGIAIMVTADAFAKLLDISDVDLLPWVRENTARMQARLASNPQRTWKAPGKGHGLSQPVDRYLGTYTNSMWGEAKLASRDETLTMTIGTLELRLNSVGDDRFELQIPSSQAMPARFQLDDEGRVTGFTVTIPLGKTEFRKAG